MGIDMFECFQEVATCQWEESLVVSLLSSVKECTRQKESELCITMRVFIQLWFCSYRTSNKVLGFKHL